MEEEFKKELKALLEKYNASIEYSACGDATDITDEEMCICHNIKGTWESIDLIRVKGRYIEIKHLD